jgi:HD-GYP domain-containing protein (c-di-GMP phosphodiesterase class II)
MRRIARERLPFTLALLSASAIVPAALVHYVGPRESTFSGTAHLVMVVVSAVIAAAAACALTVIGARVRDARSVVLGTAFMAMTALLVVHGLATPGVLVDDNGVIALAGAASLPVGAALLSLARITSLRGPDKVFLLLVLQGVLVFAIVGLGLAAMWWPELVPRVPETGSPAAVALLVFGLLFYGLLAVRAAGTFALTRRGADFLVVLGIVWLGAALIPQLLMSPATLALYVGHGLELLGIALVGIPVAMDLRRDTASSRPLVGDLSAVEMVAAEEAFLGARIHRLMVELAEKDHSTEMHTRRVATYAVALGEELALSPARLRALALGGILHDIGKLSVSTEILSKPGKLDDREFAEIKRHPQAGADLLAALGGFSGDVRRLVLDHHERLDGSGYPRGLRADDLDLETRILAVCDVFDALVSERAYRPAWPREQALEFLRERAGTQFDPMCVAALERVVSAHDARADVARSLALA